MFRPTILRPARFDDLGLRRAMSDRLFPALVAAMTFLAALTLAGAVAISSIAKHWRSGAAAVLTVQVPHPSSAGEDGTRLDRVTALLRGSPGINSVRVLSTDELADLLRPWLGNLGHDSAMPLPAVIEVRLVPGEVEPDGSLEARLAKAAPGTFMEGHGVWLKRLTTLASSLQMSAGLALMLVTAVGTAVVAVATRSGLAARRDAVEIVHGLGATDDFIARSFASRATILAVIGAGIGVVLALPVLFSLAALVQPLFGQPADFSMWGVTATLWLSLLTIPVLVAAISWMTTQITVRRWLKDLP